MKRHFVSCDTPISQRSYKILIVADCRVNKDFIDTLCARLNVLGDLIYIDTSRKTISSVARRHFSYLVLALNAIFNGKNYKAILFWQQFIGLYYSLLSHMIIKRTDACLMPFIFKSRKGVLGRIYKAFINLGLRDKVIKGAICHSSAELIHYHKVFFRNKDKIFFIPYGQSPMNKNHRNNANNISCEKPYFFSGGTSNRDYLMLATVAEKINFPFVVACTRKDIKGIECPHNVKVYHDAYGDKFDALLGESSAVILLSRDPNISSGQIVLLKAMQMGKPVVVTDSAGSVDYVDENCAFFVEHNNQKQLIKVLEYVISNPQEAQRRAKNAYVKYYEKFTLDHFAFRVADLISKSLGEKQ